MPPPDHAFLSNPWGKDVCDRMIDEDGRARLCAAPARDHGHQLAPKSLRFYIASRLENAAAVAHLASALREEGHQHTYDWTVHGSLQGQGVQRIRECAHDELAGVVSADVVIVLLPGGRGTHTELGAALASGRRVILAGDEGCGLDDSKRTCAFYHHGLVSIVEHDDEQLRERAIVVLVRMRAREAAGA